MSYKPTIVCGRPPPARKMMKYEFMNIMGRNWEDNQNYTGISLCAAHASLVFLASARLTPVARYPFSYGNFSLKCSAICVLVATHTPSLLAIYSTIFFRAWKRPGLPMHRQWVAIVIILGEPSSPSSYNVSNALFTWSKKSVGEPNPVGTLNL